MRNLAMEISEDYVIDDENASVADDAAIDGAFGDDIDTLNSDIKEVAAMEQEIHQLQGSMRAIDNFGINQTAFALMGSAGLLTGTSLESIALESLTHEDRNGVNSRMAVEALGEKIKEKAAAWAAKILSTLTKGAEKITSVIKPLWDTISEKAKILTAKTWDAAKVAADTVKAHPYKTIIAVLAAAAAVIGIVTFVGTALPVGTVTNSALETFMARLAMMYKNVKWPFGKVYTDVLVDGQLVLARVETAEQVARQANKVGALGWTAAAVRAVGTQAAKCWTAFGSGMKAVWSRVIKPIYNLGEKIFFIPKDLGNYVKEKSGSRLTGWGAEQVAASVLYPIIFRIAGNIYQMIKKIVVKAFEMVSSTFKALIAFAA